MGGSEALTVNRYHLRRTAMCPASWYAPSKSTYLDLCLFVVLALPAPASLFLAEPEHLPFFVRQAAFAPVETLPQRGGCVVWTRARYTVITLAVSVT